METCPKCGTPASTDACHKCGLVFACFAPEVLDEGVPEELKELWSSLQGRWEKREDHAVFFERALLQAQGAYAARCYRSKGDDPKAQEQLARLVERLEHQLFAGQSSRRVPKKTWRYLTYLLFALAVCGTLMYLFGF